MSVGAQSGTVTNGVSHRERRMQPFLWRRRCSLGQTATADASPSEMIFLMVRSRPTPASLGPSPRGRRHRRETARASDSRGVKCGFLGSRDAVKVEL